MSEAMNTFALSVADELSADGEIPKAEARGPGVVAIILAVVEAVIAALKECQKTPAQAALMARRPGVRNINVVRSIVQSKTPEWKGRHVWKRLKMVSAVMRAGAHEKAEGFGAMYAATPPAGDASKQEE